MHSKILESTYKRYKIYWHRLLTYVYRLTILQHGPNLHYVLTPAQQQALHQILTVIPHSLPQPATQPPAWLPTPTKTDSVIISNNSSSPAVLSFSASLDKPHVISIASSLASLSPTPSLPARTPRSLRQRRPTPYRQSSAEGTPPSPENQPSSGTNPSGWPSPALFAGRRSSPEQEEPRGEFAAAVNEAFRSSPPLATTLCPAPATSLAPAPTSAEL